MLKVGHYCSCPTDPFRGSMCVCYVSGILSNHQEFTKISIIYYQYNTSYLFSRRLLEKNIIGWSDEKRKNDSGTGTCMLERKWPERWSRLEVTPGDETGMDTLVVIG